MSNYYDEDDFLMLSGIQHYVYCKRQWCLIHVEQQWAENRFTAEGQQLHKKADNPYLKEKRKDSFISRAIPVSSKYLGLNGILDVVEFFKSDEGISIPGRKYKWVPRIVEFKRGKPKNNPCDIAQLVAEVISLEESLHCTIPSSFIYYNSVHRRISVDVSIEMRQWVKRISDDMHYLFDNQITLGPEYCTCDEGSSLRDISMAHILNKNKDIEQYIFSSMNEE